LQEETNPDATSYYKSEIESSTDALRKNPKRFLKSPNFLNSLLIQ